MYLFKELKRRNVFRVGVAYVITGWLIAQVAELAADSFGAPAWVMKMIITMLVLGSPVTLVMAWAYELTPGGLRRDYGEEAGQSSEGRSTGKLDRAITLALVAALAYFAYDKFVLDPKRDAALLESVSQPAAQDPGLPAQPESQPQPAQQSIAVLAFTNMSDDASNEYFSDGLSEELLNLLVKIPELRVAARTSSFSFKGKDVQIPQIAQELNVTYVLEGSVRKAGNKVRVTAQLIQAEDGFHLWSETFNRDLDDIFVVQDEIAAAVVTALKITLLGAMPKPRRTDPEVYSLYLQGNYFNKLRREDSLDKALTAFKQALAIDPEYAPAWVGIQFTYSHLGFSGWLPRDQAYELSLEALEKALAIDENLASAWASMAYIKRSFKWDWQGASLAMEKALQLEPNNANVIGSAASLASSFGQLNKAIELFERNVELDPLSLSSLNALGNRYRAVGRYEEARALYRQVLALNPEYPETGLNIVGIFLSKGEPERALGEIEKLPESSSREFQFIKSMILFKLGEELESQLLVDKILESSAQNLAWQMATIYAWQNENDAAFEWLEVGFEQREFQFSFILWNHILARLGSDPRYPVFLEKMGLREYWEAMPENTLAIPD